MKQIVLARRRFAGSGIALAAMALVALSAGESLAQAVESAGCAAVNSGSLNLSANDGGVVSRSVPLEAGETLTLTLAMSDGARVAVSAGGAVLQASRSNATMFVAPSSSIFEIKLDADRGADARLTGRCASVAKSAAERALLERRKSFVASRDPDRIRIDRPPTEAKAIDSLVPSQTDGAPPREVTASISLSELTDAMKIGTPHQPSVLDFWFEGRYTTYDTLDIYARQSDGNFSEMYFGSKYMIGPDIMVGYLAQFDQTGEDTLDGNSLSASGWMAGPYMSVRMGNGVFLDARAAQGVTETLPNGIAVDSHSAERSLLRGKLRGERQVAGWTVMPSIGLSYVEDTFANGGADEEAQAVGTGRLDMLPEVKRRFDLNSTTFVEPRIAAGGFMAFDNLSELSPESMSGQMPDLHWKAEAGVAVGVKDGVAVQATGGVESGGEAAPDNWSGRLQLKVPLGK